MKAINAYKSIEQSSLEEQVYSASPQKLILMLYNELIRSLKTLSLHPNDHKTAQHSVDIIIELIASLNEDIEITKDLRIIYDILIQWILLARLHNDSIPIDKCLDLILPIYEAWDEQFN